MTVTSHSFSKLDDSRRSGLVNFASAGDTFKCLLLASYTPAVDSHQFVSDVLGAGSEVANGNGYTTGGVTLTSQSWTLASHTYTFTATIPIWTASGGSIVAAFALFYKSTGSNSTSPVLAYWDLGGSQTATSGNTFTLTPSGSGILTWTGTG